MSSFDQKEKKRYRQKSTAYKQEKQQLTETVPKEVQKLDLLDKDFKLPIINKFKELKEIMSNN